MADRLVLDPVEQRVLGALLEKQRTVPDTYPLSLNALLAACNQSTSRDPVTAYDQVTVVDALGRLRDRDLVRFVKRTGIRVVKYHQRLEEQLGLDGAQAALIAVLLLRGGQTAGELRQRCERLHPFDDREAAEAVLGALAVADPPLVRELDRQPGQHDRRWIHLLGAEPSAAAEPEPPVDREQVLTGGAAARDRLVAAEYDRLAGSYTEALGDELDAKPFDRWLLERLAADSAGGQGLDVGCGPAQVAGFLADRGVQMTGLDLSSSMVEQARLRRPDVQVIQGSFVVPPMPRGGDPRDPGWSLVTAWYAFVHLAQSELVPVIGAMTRVLRRGGVLALATHVGNEVRHPGSLFGVSTELDFVLHDPDAVVAAAGAAGLVDLEWYRRSPLPQEAATERLYLCGRRAE
jgi:uncharacterized protein YceH (UPF0502 family)/2-polyprenyl-3-methyl-5-hydroxy-6-metoxy-1,4-benzoquinol methylase